MWGRTIYENVRKFVQFQLTMNISLLAIVFISVCSLGAPPFQVIHLIWINMIMDVLAACAICTEPFIERPEQKNDDNDNDNLNSLPRESRKAKIIRIGMWRNMLPQIIY